MASVIMKHSDSREVVVPVIAAVVHPVVTIVLCVLYWYCIKPYFQNRLPALTQLSKRRSSADKMELPSYWKNRGNCVEKMDITRTYTAKCIERLVSDLWSPLDVGKRRDATARGPADIKIKRVYRLGNAELFRQYDAKRQKMVKKKEIINVDHFRSLKNLSSAEIRTTEMIRKDLEFMNSPLKSVIHGINEHFLFHGTKPENLDSVWREGLRTEFISRATYGKGIYMAENQTKSDQYTGDTRDKHMFLCRACLGEMYVLKTDRTTDYDTPPCRECLQPNCTIHKYTFDSTVVNIPTRLKFREFIVLRDYRTYPEYLIIYQHINLESQA